MGEPRKCQFCQKHRWCASCNKGWESGERCPECNVELQPAPAQFPMPVAGDKPQMEWLHRECAGLVQILRAYQGCFFALHGHTMQPIDRAFRHVTETGFRGFLDLKIATTTKGSVFESQTRVILSPSTAKEIPGYHRFPINPELVAQIHKSTAVEKTDDMTTHDMEALRERNETAGDLQ